MTKRSHHPKNLPSDKVHQRTLPFLPARHRRRTPRPQRLARHPARRHRHAPARGRPHQRHRQTHRRPPHYLNRQRLDPPARRPPLARSGRGHEAVLTARVEPRPCPRFLTSSATRTAPAQPTYARPCASHPSESGPGIWPVDLCLNRRSARRRQILETHPSPGPKAKQGEVSDPPSALTSERLRLKRAYRFRQKLKWRH